MTDDKPGSNESETKKFKFFAFKQLLIALLLLVAFLWTIRVFSGYFDKSPQKTDKEYTAAKQTPQSQASGQDLHTKPPAPESNLPVAAGIDKVGRPASRLNTALQTENAFSSSPLQTGANRNIEANPDSKPEHQVVVKNEPGGHEIPGKRELPSNATVSKPKLESEHERGKPALKEKPVGVTFVEATMRPLHHELKERFWGWRPNDILDFTDNVNNYQLGVLEVTRRTAVVLSERISRTGTNDALDPNLENAMNWFMIKADRYWFPSAESKYKEGLKELDKYKQKLWQGRASFYIRSDNLIPLLSSYEDLLGSCDKNLVKASEEDGSPVSYFKADDYVYYSRGVASAMLTILEAVQHEFSSILESRHGTELLHHAIESCKRATAIDPILVFNSNLDGIFANHRANMAAPISHARFYLGQLIKTLST